MATISQNGGPLLCLGLAVCNLEASQYHRLFRVSTSHENVSLVAVPAVSQESGK